MTLQEPERLALEIQAILERRANLRAFLQQRLGGLVTSQERLDIESVIDLLERQIAELEARLASLRR